MAYLEGVGRPLKLNQHVNNETNNRLNCYLITQNDGLLCERSKRLLFRLDNHMRIIYHSGMKRKRDEDWVIAS